MSLSQAIQTKSPFAPTPRWSEVMRALLAGKTWSFVPDAGGILLLLDGEAGETVRTLLSFEGGSVHISVDRPLDPETDHTIVMGSERDWSRLLLLGDASALRRLRFCGAAEPLQLLTQLFHRFHAPKQETGVELWH